jgi:hypothetical protein
MASRREVVTVEPETRLLRRRQAPSRVSPLVIPHKAARRKPSDSQNRPQGDVAGIWLLVEELDHETLDARSKRRVAKEDQPRFPGRPQRPQAKAATRLVYVTVSDLAAAALPRDNLCL